MKIIYTLFFIVILTQNISAQDYETWNSLKAPGLTPELFPVFMADTTDNKHSRLTFTPGGKEIYFSVYKNREHPQKIYYVKYHDGKWSEPRLVSFSGVFKDGGPMVSHDGKRIYFYSKRPLNEADSINSNYDIWYAGRSDENWGSPVWAGEKINSDVNESVFEILADGTMIIFTYDSEMNWLLYQSKLVGGIYQEKELIKRVSAPGNFEEPIKVIDKDFMIIDRNVKKGKYYYSYLYISVRKDNGDWTDFSDMGELINEGEGRFPSFSPDGKYFFFTSYRSGRAEFYWVDAQYIYNMVNEMKKM